MSFYKILTRYDHYWFAPYYLSDRLPMNWGASWRPTDDDGTCYVIPSGVLLPVVSTVEELDEEHSQPLILLQQKKVEATIAQGCRAGLWRFGSLAQSLLEDAYQNAWHDILSTPTWIESKPYSWLGTVACHAGIQTAVKYLKGGNSEADIEPEPFDGIAVVLAAITVGETWGYLKASLNSRQQAIMNMAVEGLKQKDMARLLGVSPAAICKDMKRIRDLLESILGGEDPPDPSGGGGRGNGRGGGGCSEGRGGGRGGGGRGGGGRGGGGRGGRGVPRGISSSLDSFSEPEMVAFALILLGMVRSEIAPILRMEASAVDRLVDKLRAAIKAGEMPPSLVNLPAFEECGDGVDIWECQRHSGKQEHVGALSMQRIVSAMLRLPAFQEVPRIGVHLAN